MVLSVITLAAITPLLATSTLQLQETAQKQQSQQSGLDKELKTEKCHLRVKESERMSESRKEIVKDRIVFLRNKKVECAHKKKNNLSHLVELELTDLVALRRKVR